jgi:RNase P/RNase MRP subunit p29
VAKGELLGLPVAVARAPDPGIVGLAGDVVGETRNTFTIRVGGPGGRRIVVAKDGHTFRFTLADGATVDVAGDAVRFRGEDRTKKVR